MTTKNVFITAGIALAVGFILGARMNCSGRKKAVEVPEVSGSITATDSIVHDKVIAYLPGKVIKSKKDSLDLVDAKAEIYRVQSEYTLLDEAFAKYNDSVQQAKYRQVIKPKTFSQAIEDSLLSGKIQGIVFNGLVQPGMRFDYKLKKRTVEVKSKELYFRFLAGGGFGVNKELNQGAYQVKAAAQFKKGTTCIAGYQNIAGQIFLTGDVLIPIFSLKK